MVRVVQNFPSEKNKFVYIYRYLWIQSWPESSNKKLRKSSRLIIWKKKSKQKTNQTPSLKITVVWRVPSQRHSRHLLLHSWHLMLQGPSVLLGSQAFLRRGDLCDTCNHWVLLHTSCYCSLLLPELHKPKCRTRKVVSCLTYLWRQNLN